MLLHTHTHTHTLEAVKTWFN